MEPVVLPNMEPVVLQNVEPVVLPNVEPSNIGIYINKSYNGECPDFFLDNKGIIIIIFLWLIFKFIKYNMIEQ